MRAGSISRLEGHHQLVAMDAYARPKYSTLISCIASEDGNSASESPVEGWHLRRDVRRGKSCYKIREHHADIHVLVSAALKEDDFPTSGFFGW